jgi:hypothetical protein
VSALRFHYLIGKTTMTTVIDNATQTIITNAPTVNGIDDLLHDIGTLAVDVGNAENFAVSGKERLTKLLADLRETGAVLAGDTRTNKTRATLRDAIAETGVSAQRVKDILSFLTLYYGAACMVTTLQNNAAVKASIAKQVEVRQGAGENVVQGTTKESKPKKTEAEKAKERADKTARDFQTQLNENSIELTIERLKENNDYHLFVNYIYTNGSDDGFAEYMATYRLDKAARKADLEAQIAALQAQLR